MSDYIQSKSVSMNQVIELIPVLTDLEQRVADLEIKAAQHLFTIRMLIACVLISAVHGILQAFQIL